MLGEPIQYLFYFILWLCRRSISQSRFAKKTADEKHKFRLSIIGVLFFLLHHEKFLAYTERTGRQADRHMLKDTFSLYDRSIVMDWVYYKTRCLVWHWHWQWMSCLHLHKEGLRNSREYTSVLGNDQIQCIHNSDLYPNSFSLISYLLLENKNG